MLEHARAKGGNAVIGMRFDTSEMGDVWTELCAYGTAVVAIPVTDGAKQTAAALGYGQPGGSPAPRRRPQQHLHYHSIADCQRDAAVYRSTRHEQRQYQQPEPAGVASHTAVLAVARRAGSASSLVVRHDLGVTAPKPQSQETTRDRSGLTASRRIRWARSACPRPRSGGRRRSVRSRTSRSPDTRSSASSSPGWP